MADDRVPAFQAAVRLVRWLCLPDAETSSGVDLAGQVEQVQALQACQVAEARDPMLAYLERARELGIIGLPAATEMRDSSRI